MRHFHLTELDVGPAAGGVPGPPREASVRTLLGPDSGARGSLAVCTLPGRTPRGLRWSGGPGSAEWAALPLRGTLRQRACADRAPVAREHIVLPRDAAFAAAGTTRELSAAAGPVTALLIGGTPEPGRRPAAAGPYTPAADLVTTGLVTTGLAPRRIPAAAEPAPRSAAPDDEAALAAAGGITDMHVDWLVTTATEGARTVCAACSSFVGDGTHELHRHPDADEFFLVLEGGGEHLTEDGPVRMGPGDLVYIPAGEWHGYRTDPGLTTRTVYGYLGAGSLAAAGYELRAAEGSNR